MTVKTIEFDTEAGRFVVAAEFFEKDTDAPPPPADVPAFKQSDPPWGGMLIGTGTMAGYGCLVTSLASLLWWAGYERNPGDLLTSLKEIGTFDGNYLSHPSKVEELVPGIKWWKEPRYPTSNPRETSKINWTDFPADLDLLTDLLHNQPVPVKVDYKPITKDIEEHFVLALQYIPDPDGGLEDDLLIMDPITGTKTSVLTYFNPTWFNDWMKRENVTKVARTLVGARVWEVQF